MYSTCLFCTKPLGANEVIETFPVGRRIAFDNHLGRLWVVCGACERWNLSPLDERWEVIEECERLFANERKRVSTENIGLAKLNEGLVLVRIGKPMRPEFAAWRYGDQFGRRRRRDIIRTGVGLGVVGGMYLGGWLIGGSFLAFASPVNTLVSYMNRPRPSAIVARGEGHRTGFKYGRKFEIKRKQLKNLKIVPDSEGYMLQWPEDDDVYEFRGDNARRVLSQVLPVLNSAGAGRSEVQTAVSMIELAGEPEGFMKTAVKDHANTRLPWLPTHTRLAFEMATHEDAERRALEGELQELERAWKEAEEIAAISDSLLTPTFIQETIQRFKRG